MNSRATAESATLLSTKLNIGDRTYELIIFLAEGKDCATDTMVARAKELGANLGEEDGRYVLDHQDELPREYIHLIFPDWHHPSEPESVAYLYFDGECWDVAWEPPSGRWDESELLVRRAT